MKKKSSENDQLTGHFQSFFIYFFRPPETKSEKNPVNQLIKNYGLTKTSHYHDNLDEREKLLHTSIISKKQSDLSVFVNG